MLKGLFFYWMILVFVCDTIFLLKNSVFLKCPITTAGTLYGTTAISRTQTKKSKLKKEIVTKATLRLGGLYGRVWGTRPQSNRPI